AEDRLFPAAGPPNGAAGRLGEIEEKLSAAGADALQGNSREAIAVAGPAERRLRRSPALPDRNAQIKAEFAVHCEMHDDRCAVIVELPGYHDLRAPAHDVVSISIWHEAQIALIPLNAGVRRALAVGVRCDGEYVATIRDH